MIDAIDDQLLAFATERQKEYVEALRATGGNLKKSGTKMRRFSECHPDQHCQSARARGEAGLFSGA